MNPIEAMDALPVAVNRLDDAMKEFTRVLQEERDMWAARVAARESAKKEAA
ncbi:MAG: hypothetical protein NTX56_04255 [Proteobacteria bacterium]|nr:hypothetical protein [Pseudomonadota bacterium]